MSARQCRPLHDSVIAEIHSIDRLFQSNNRGSRQWLTATPSIDRPQHRFNKRKRSGRPKR